MCAPSPGEAMGNFAADARARADDGDDLAGEFLFGRHPAQLGFFHKPVFDVKRLLLREGDVFVHRLGTADDLDGAIIKLGGGAGLALVLAPRNHAKAGDEEDGRVGITQGRGVGVFAAVVIIRVILAIRFEAGAELGFEQLNERIQFRFVKRRAGGGEFGRSDVDEEGFYFGAEEMVGATGAEFGEARGDAGVDEAEEGFRHRSGWWR